MADDEWIKQHRQKPIFPENRASCESSQHCIGRNRSSPVEEET